MTDKSNKLIEAAIKNGAVILEGTYDGYLTLSPKQLQATIDTVNSTAEPVATVTCRNGEWYGRIPVKVLEAKKVEVGDKLYLHQPLSKDDYIKRSELLDAFNRWLNDDNGGTSSNSLLEVLYNLPSAAINKPYNKPVGYVVPDYEKVMAVRDGHTLMAKNRTDLHSLPVYLDKPDNVNSIEEVSDALPVASEPIYQLGVGTEQTGVKWMDLSKEDYEKTLTLTPSEHLHNRLLYTSPPDATMPSQANKAVNDALEKAARVCDQLEEAHNKHDRAGCGDAIRALKDNG